MPNPAANNPAQCPICGLSNQCAQANPASATQPCWCFSVTLNTQTLASPGAVLNRNTCLCPNCALAEPAKASDAP